LGSSHGENQSGEKKKPGPGNLDRACTKRVVRAFWH
jgi:hypothetical protein